MSDSTPEYPVHEGSEEPPVTSPAIGHDEWVARHFDRRLPPRLGPCEERLRLVPWWVWLVLFLGAACLLPVSRAARTSATSASPPSSTCCSRSG